MTLECLFSMYFSFSFFNFYQRYVNYIYFSWIPEFFVPYFLIFLEVFFHFCCLVGGPWSFWWKFSTIFQFVCSNCSPVTTVLRILHTLCPLWMWLLSFKSLQYCHLASFFAISPATPLSKAFPGLTLQRAWEAHCILRLGETTF